MNAARALAQALTDEGVDLIFGYPGGAILPFYDALYDGPIRHVLTRHEQAAIFAADGYARVTGRPGVCVATSGPGATNLVTGLANAFLDSVPLLAITGQVPTSLMGSDAFQEVDILGMTMPVVKHSWLIRDPHAVYRTARQALRIARSGRPGPVLVDLPKDVQLAEVGQPWSDLAPLLPPRTPDPVSLTRALDLLQAAERPLIYGGGGIALAGAVDAFRDFAETTGAPVVLTLKALGALSGNHPQCLGMLGMHGLKAANLAVGGCDLLVCVGARFDDRVTGQLDRFCPEARVIHLDIDPAEVGKRRSPDAPVIGDLCEALPALSVPLDIEPWRRQCAAWKAASAWSYDAPGESVYAPRLFRDLSRAARRRGGETYVAVDVGQHQMWVAQHYAFARPEHLLSSSGLGAMGYGLPAAIGVAFARPEARVLCVCGDGGFQINPQELATITRYRLPIKIVLVDNSRLGMVRQWQELFNDGRYAETDLSDNPDFVRIAEAFGVPAFTVDRAADVPGAIERLLDTPGPLLAHVRIDPAANVWPFVPPGAPNTQMMEGT